MKIALTRGLRKPLLSARYYATKPKFNWRTMHIQQPPPSIDYIRCPFEANEVLGSLRSSRLTCQMGYNSTREGPWLEIHAEAGIGIIALADEEGVVVLHLEAMKQVPTLLKEILESDNIVKQNICGIAFQHRIFNEYEKFGTQPSSILDLRLLAEELYPGIFPKTISGLSESKMLKMATDILLDLDISSTIAAQYNWEVDDLAGSPGLEYIVNSTWCQHILGLILHGALEAKKEEMEKTLVGRFKFRQLMYDITYGKRDIELLKQSRARELPLK